MNSFLSNRNFMKCSLMIFSMLFFQHVGMASTESTSPPLTSVVHGHEDLGEQAEAEIKNVEKQKDDPNDEGLPEAQAKKSERKTSKFSSYTSYYKKLPKHTLDGLFIVGMAVSMYFGWSPEFVPVVVGLLSAEVITAHFHWFEDSYDVFPKDEIICPNRNHHFAPREMITHSPSEVMSGAAKLTIPLAGLAWWTGMPTASLYSMLFSTTANWVHQMAHHTPKEVKDISYIIWALQKVGLMQSRDHHQKHHYSKDRDTDYCVLTDYLNPIFSHINYWKKLEGIIKYITGVSAREHSDEESYKINCSDRDPGQFPEKLDHLRRTQFPKDYKDK